jgi:hypothetical protein
MLRLVAVIMLASSVGCSGKTFSPAPAPTAAPTAVPAKPGASQRCVEVATKIAGDLEIYPMITQIGTVARRVQRDDKGRVASTIYYRQSPSSTSRTVAGSFRKEDLVIQSVRLQSYDAQGRKTRTEQCDHKLRLASTLDVEYDGAAQVRRVHRNGRGLHTHVVDARTGSHVYYDASGEKVAGIRGLIPQGHDLAYGWGSDNGGLACGIAPRATSSTLDQAVFFVTVRNTSAQPSQLITALPFQTIELELRAGDGTLQAQNAEAIAKRKRSLLKINSGPNENLQSLRPNEALGTSYMLSDWYANLAPGQYRLTIRRRAAGKSFSLVSNTVDLTLAAR